MQTFESPTDLRRVSCVWTIVNMAGIRNIVGMGIYSRNYTQKNNRALYFSHALKVSPLGE